MSYFNPIPYYLETKEGQQYVHYRNYDRIDLLKIPEEYEHISKVHLFPLKNQRILAYSSKHISFLIFKIENAILILEKILGINAVDFAKFQDINDTEAYILYLGKQHGNNRERVIYLYDVAKKDHRESIELERFYDQAEAAFLDSRYFYTIFDGNIHIYDTKRKIKKPIFSIMRRHGYIEQIKIPKPVKINDSIILYDTGDHFLIVYDVKKETSTKIPNSEYASDYYIDKNEQTLHAAISRLGADKLILRTWDINTLHEEKTIEIPLNVKIPDNIKIGWEQGFNISREDRELTDKGNFVISLSIEEEEEIKENIKKILSKNIKLAKPLIGIIAKFII